MQADEDAAPVDNREKFTGKAGVYARFRERYDAEAILPLLRGDTFARRGALHWENQQNLAVLDGEWKLVHQFWLGQPMLFRPAEDAGEEKDLAAQNPQKVAELLALHEAWAKRHFPNRTPHVKARPLGLFPRTRSDP